MPIILNHDNVALDGHDRRRACKELGLPVTFNVKNFTGYQRMPPAGKKDNTSDT